MCVLKREGVSEFKAVFVVCSVIKTVCVYLSIHIYLFWYVLQQFSSFHLLRTLRLCISMVWMARMFILNNRLILGSIYEGV